MNRKRVLLVFGPIAAVMVWLVARVTMSQTEPNGPVMIPATQKEMDRIGQRMGAAEIALKRVEKTAADNMKSMNDLVESQKNLAAESRIQKLEAQLVAAETSMRAFSNALDASVKGLEKVQKAAKEDLIPFERSQQALRSEIESLSGRVQAAETSATAAASALTDVVQKSAACESLFRDSVKDLETRLKSSEAAGKSTGAQLIVLTEEVTASREILRTVLGNGILSGLEVLPVAGSELLAVRAGQAITSSGRLVSVPREVVVKVDELTTADRNLFVVLANTGDVRLVRSVSPPTDVVVLGKIIRNGTDPMSVDVSVRSRTIQMAPQTAAK